MDKKIYDNFTVEEIIGEVGDRLKKDYFMYSDGVVRILPKGWVAPATFLKYADLMYKFEVKPDDIYVNTYPKSGTTWIQEVVWNLVHNPDLDNPQTNMSLDARFPNFEADMYMATTGAPPPDQDGDAMKMFAALCPGKHYLEGVLIHLAALAPTPRMLKNHLPLSLYPADTLKKGKVVYAARDPRDVIVSLYHFFRLHLLFGYKGTLDQLIDDIINDTALFTPYWEHLKEAWDLRDHPNLCFIFFEDLKEDPCREIKRLDKFLGTNRTDAQIKNVANHTDFSALKERSKTNQPTSNSNLYFNKDVEKKEGGFFRKGIVGDWKNSFTPEQVNKINAWVAKNTAQFGKEFKYK